MGLARRLISKILRFIIIALIIVLFQYEICDFGVGKHDNIKLLTEKWRKVAVYDMEKL